jgi:pimeloyl-ACP methyl ester carboxylesterase
MCRLLIQTCCCLFLALLPACSSRYATLKDETDAALYDKNDEHACLCREFDNCHVTTHHVLTHGPSGVDCRVAVHELGPADGAPVVLIHGVFADHTSWRFVAPLLARTRHVFVVDLPGCGASDAPEATAETEADLYAPHAMARRVGDALASVLADTAPRPVTVVAHSLGGFVTLRMLDDPDLHDRFAPLNSRIDRLVLIAPLDGIVEKADPAFLAVASLSGFDVAVGSMLGIMQQKVTDVVLKSVSEESDALRAEADKRMEILKDAPRRRAMQSMLRQVVPLKPGAADFDPDWDRMLADAVQVRDIRKPALILWGERDEVISVSVGYRLWANMPDAEMRVFAKCRHSPQIEEPAACASIIDDFMSADAANAITRTVGPASEIDVKRVARLLPRAPVRPDATAQPVEGGR